MFHRPQKRVDVDILAFAAARDVYEQGIEARYGERPARTVDGNTIIRKAVGMLGAYCVVEKMRQFIESDRFIDTKHSLESFQRNLKGE